MIENHAKLALHLHSDRNPVNEASRFDFGTLTGYWHYYGPDFCGWPGRVLGIVGVYNEPAGNGQFALFLSQLIALCLEQQVDLAGLDVNNHGLAAHLIKEWGFQRLPNSSHLVRSCRAAATGARASQ